MTARKSYNITTSELAVSTTTDYYPFGMPMPNRQIVGGEQYRYSFQGQEKDPETEKEAFQLRLWDGRIGRWLTTDPAGQYSSPYVGMGNNPISSIDPDGGSSCGGEGEPPCPENWHLGGDIPEVVITVPKSNRDVFNAAMLFTMTRSAEITVVLAEDDITGIGIGDDPAIPVFTTVAVLAGIGYLATKDIVTNGPLYMPLSGPISTTAGYTPRPVPFNPNADFIMSLMLTESTFRHQMSKGGPRNVWPNGEYDIPDLSKINWQNANPTKLANNVTGPNPPGGKGPGSSWSKIKKWFRNKKAQMTNKNR